MKYTLNIVKTYTFNETFEESFSRLQAIVEAPFSDSKYSLYGDYFLTDPPEFNFYSKCASVDRPYLCQLQSTKISATIYKLDNKTKITIKTTTNPIFLIFLAVCGIAIIVQLIKYKTSEDLKMILGYFVTAIIILGLDRFIKNMVVAGFESDAKIQAND